LRRDLAALYGQSGLPGRFGVREPAPKRPLAAADFPALILCPGLAFDRRGRRLGRGRGFYDRFFAALDHNAGGNSARPGFTALGFGMDCQIVDSVPVDRRDRAVRGFITEKRLLLV
jgi:5-formyltetrahydrofolate cyclo-ligase